LHIYWQNGKIAGSWRHMQHCGGNLCNIAGATRVANWSNYACNNGNINIFYFYLFLYLVV